MIRERDSALLRLFFTEMNKKRSLRVLLRLQSWRSTKEFKLNGTLSTSRWRVRERFGELNTAFVGILGKQQCVMWAFCCDWMSNCWKLWTQPENLQEKLFLITTEMPSSGQNRTHHRCSVWTRGQIQPSVYPISSHDIVKEASECSGPNGGDQAPLWGESPFMWRRVCGSRRELIDPS